MVPDPQEPFRRISAAVRLPDRRRQSLAVLSSLPRIGHHDVSTAIDVCSASGPRHVTDVANSVTGLAWADNGHDLAFLSTKSAVLTPEHVYTVPASGGTAEDRTPNLDATAASLGGDVRGRVLVLVDRGVRTEVDEFHDDSLTIVFQWPDGVVAGLPVSSPYTGTSRTGRLQCRRSAAHPQRRRPRRQPPPHRSPTRATPSSPRSISAQVRVVHWKSKEGIALEGIATFPAGYVEGQKYKFLVLPHGGPEANDQLSLDPFSRTIAGLGYVVLQPEYRGSTGYGADFLAAIYQHFGDRAYHDVDSATDYAITQGWADPNRLAIFGWSAGGFMTSWTVTQTNRYKAAVEGAGITDWAPFLWTSDIQQIDYDQRWTDEDPARLLPVLRRRLREERHHAAAHPPRRSRSPRPHLPGHGIFPDPRRPRQNRPHGHLSRLAALPHPLGAAPQRHAGTRRLACKI